MLAWLARALVKTGGRLLGGSLQPAARRIEEGAKDGDLSTLDGHLFCLLLTRRRDGRLVPTPLSFAREALVAPCGPRGRPLGEAIAVRARVLADPAECEAAEAAITARYGLRGRVWSGLLLLAKLDAEYIELTSP